MKPRIGVVAALAGFLVVAAPTTALAQTPGSHGLLTAFGEYFLIGGGVTNYFDAAVNDHVDTGTAWELRAGFGNRFFVGGELAYVGSTRSANGFGSALVTQGLESALRVQYPYQSGKWLLEPFAFVGVGWTHFKLNNASRFARSDVDDLLVLPAGAGVMAEYDRFLFDVRFTYRQTFAESLVTGYDGSAASLKSWAITASVGVEF